MGEGTGVYTWRKSVLGCSGGRENNTAAVFLFPLSKKSAIVLFCSAVLFDFEKDEDDPPSLLFHHICALSCPNPSYCSTACTTMVGNNSLYYPLLVANGTYIFTAGNCVMCSCNAANNWTQVWLQLLTTFIFVADEQFLVILLLHSLHRLLMVISMFQNSVCKARVGASFSCSSTWCCCIFTLCSEMVVCCMRFRCIHNHF
ncbi:hypothetical protein RHMOL_Rhmol11G0188400 [Rhododendron molle]|uniref:Uncharacterized protein n=1 Tax=Rhododendron molle TaxID=49168 RepID=A0ACC0LV17_RHOML|nr:hypothetical protein RHMOL_Rhmol11G0188400 [Rhododendron molle]